MWESVTVELAHTSQHQPRPRSFHWHGTRLIIVDIGRRWQQDGAYHLLVRTADHRVFELRQRATDWQARLHHHPPAPV
jgi:hypothetical protein